MASNPFEGNELFEFGPFRLDVRARVLWRDGEPVPLAPKSFDVLAHLVRNAGRAVSREELLAAVWPDVVVSDGSLTQAVFVVRRALGESEDAPGFLATVPRVGYRFSADVRALSSAPAVPAAPRPGPVDAVRAAAARRVWTAAVGVAFLLLAAAAVRWAARRSAPTPERPALLSLQREIAAPPDAAAVVGVAGGSAVLVAPSALYLLPLDGAQAATRVPLAVEEVPGDRLVGGELLVAAGAEVRARDVLSGRTRAIGRLPAGAPLPRAGRLLVSPGGAFLALRGADGVDVFAVSGDGVARAFRVAAKETPNEALALSDRWLAFAEGGGGPLRVFELATGARTLEAPFAETRVRALAVEDATGRVAAGGAFDSAYVFRIGGGEPEKVPVRGWTRGLVFVADVPTLVVAGRLGATAWRPGAGAVASAPAPANGGSIAATADGILVLSPERQRLAVLAFGDLAPATRASVSSAPIWALASDGDGRTVFAAGRDGKIYAIDAATRAVRAESVHTDGVPSLLYEDGLLASSSDDKTVAVWKLPGPKLLMRTRAHDFLVNDLQLARGAPGGPVLVTSSSDGSLKTWRWPELEPLESVDLAPVAGAKVEAHALWVAPDASRVLVGTWDHALLDLSRKDGRWSGRRLATAAGAVYRFAGLPALGLVAGVGIRPHEVFLLDLATGASRTLEDAGLDAYWAVGEPAGDAFVAVGDAGAARYEVRPAGGGAFEVSLVSRRRTGLELLTAALLPDGRLWAGTNDGAVLAFPRDALRGAPLLTQRIDFSRK